MVEDALIEKSVSGAKHLTRFQFERVGYFCVDFDSTNDKVIRWLKNNNTVELPNNAHVGMGNFYRDV